MWGSIVPGRESKQSKRDRARSIIGALRRTWPEAVCTLNFHTAWQLLVGAILAAQCTDERVNLVTSPMFREWPEPEDYARAAVSEIEEKIRSCGLFRNKAKNIKACAEALLERHGGVVPDKMEDLLALPGVGRKIANLMLGDAFGIPGIVVDTHCGRITRLLGLSASEQAARVEKDLSELLDPEDWIDWGHYLVRLGREVCLARCRRCGICPLRELCDYARTHQKELASLPAGGEDACI